MPCMRELPVVQICPFTRKRRLGKGALAPCPPSHRKRRIRWWARHRPRKCAPDGFAHPPLQPCYCDRYALVAVPLATDIESAPGAMVQLVAFRIRVENTMVTALLDTVEVELIVTSRLGR